MRYTRTVSLGMSCSEDMLSSFNGCVRHSALGRPRPLPRLDNEYTSVTCTRVNHFENRRQPARLVAISPDEEPLRFHFERCAMPITVHCSPRKRLRSNPLEPLATPRSWEPRGNLKSYFHTYYTRERAPCSSVFTASVFLSTCRRRVVKL